MIRVTIRTELREPTVRVEAGKVKATFRPGDRKSVGAWLVANDGALHSYGVPLFNLKALIEVALASAAAAAKPRKAMTWRTR